MTGMIRLLSAPHSNAAACLSFNNRCSYRLCKDRIRVIPEHTLGYLPAYTGAV